MAATDVARPDTVETDHDELSELVAAARAGDRIAFDELVRRTWSTTHTLAFRLTGNDDDAREVCQETYLRAYRSIRRFRGDARFTTWLHRITVNCASSHLGRRRRHRHDRLEVDEEIVDLAPAHDPVGRAEQSDLRERVQAALGTLPPKLRAVVVLRDIYDLSHESIAAELGISVSAAKVRLHRARRRLRDELFLEGPSSDAASAGTESNASVVRAERDTVVLSVSPLRTIGGGADVDPRAM